MDDYRKAEIDIRDWALNRGSQDLIVAIRSSYVAMTMQESVAVIKEADEVVVEGMWRSWGLNIIRKNPKLAIALMILKDQIMKREFEKELKWWEELTADLDPQKEEDS